MVKRNLENSVLFVLLAFISVLNYLDYLQLTFGIIIAWSSIIYLIVKLFSETGFKNIIIIIKKFPLVTMLTLCLTLIGYIIGKELSRKQPNEKETIFFYRLLFLFAIVGVHIYKVIEMTSALNDSIEIINLNELY